ncbi:hypothetical protein MNBD_ALPHA09-445 [hydrothermal vent metagenome]|uniref:DUF992 domain-containing protein n=1 Tax=hydrothermal vent metagenome TaxID=652676 RepID=A0A3B0U3S0_9ZZZZ
MSYFRTKLAPAAIAATLTLTVLAASAITMGQSQPARAQAQPLELGQLDCTVVPGSRRNLIISSTALVDCTFRPATGAATRYQGETGIGLGIDLSTKTDDRFSFLVLTAQSTTPDFDRHPLTGRYYGAEATVSLGAGVGAKVLVGGSNRQFTLAPIGGQTTMGTGISAGAGYLYLEPAR